jgi:hypothetical protein
MPFPDVHQLPESREQWRITAYAAAGLLMIDDARLYGFVTGGPVIDRDRCMEVLTLAAAQDIIVSPDQATYAGIELLAGLAQEGSE